MNKNINKIILARGIAFASSFFMMRYFPNILSAYLVTVLILGTSTKLFSQVAQSENKIEITDSSTTTLHKAPVYVKGITTARAISLLEGLLGLMSIVIGWRAKARSKKAGGRTALVLGLLAIILSIAHLTFTAGAVFGSGSGKAGAILALVLGLVGCILGRKALRMLP